MPPTVETSIAIDAPDAVVFDVAQDYALRLSWDPFLRVLRAEDGARGPAVGGRVWVRAQNGIAMTVEYVTIDRPRRVAVRMTSRSRLFERFAGTWLFESRGSGGTHVVFRYGFETHWWLLRPLLDRVIVRRFTRDLRLRLAALKRAAEDKIARDKIAATA
ncbi:MAG TPA: SRPBCC family protein [Polyangia bacterium]|jgi:ribosome-associated toxin RatA of RatAB toxin-antitoxin module|nr:SRPBCC family protein [Polyangia bacterium]